MKKTWTIAVCATLGLVGVPLACTTTNNTGPTNSSDVGQSCGQTADCKAGLECVGNMCVENGAEGGTGSSGSSSGGSNADASGSSGSSSGGSSSSGGAVPEAAPPRLGAAGDVCMSTAQCAAGLECLPLQVAGSSGVIAPIGLGTCQLSNYGLDASTGKTCTGECNAAADCCVLPPNVSINGTTYHSCLDIKAQVIGTGSCTGLANGDSTPLGVGCFYYQTYCNGCMPNGAAAWACTNNQCVFAAACQRSDVVIGGCAPLSRANRTLSTTCTNHACGGAAAPVCTHDIDCAGQTYVPYSNNYPYNIANTCTADAGAATDCKCSGGACYLACTKDLDCANGYSCDTTTSLCKSLAGCTTDAQCVALKYNTLAKCVSSACVVPCSTDQECNPAGSAGFTGQACIGGTCQAVGCNTDTDCNITGRSDVRMFCVTPAAVTTGEVSAITN